MGEKMKKSVIEANHAAEDVRAGLDDAALMKKYGLSARGLQSLLKKLVSAGIVKKSEIDARTSENSTSVIVDLVSPQEETEANSGTSGAAEERPRVIAISEDPDLLSSVRNLLELREIIVIACADADLNLFRHIRPQLALVDFKSGKSSHEELFISLRQADESIPVIAMVDSARDFAPESFENRIYDIVEKPIDKGPFISAVSRALEYCSLLRFKLDQERLARQTAYGGSDQNLQHLRETLDVTILTLAKMAEIRANGASANINQIQKLCRILSETAASRPAFKKILTPEFIDDLVRSCVLHDIGKAALPDSALQGEEWTDQETLRQHPVFGGRSLEEAATKLGDGSFFSVGKDIAYYHHERWDGSGYPFGLRGEEIPLAARILAVADAYARMVSGSPHGEPCSHEEACKRILAAKGSQFDPELVDVFLEVEGDFREI